MKTVKDKYLVVGADFAGYPLKEAVVAHLKAKGWKITDLGVTAESDPDEHMPDYDAKSEALLPLLERGA